MQIRNQQDFWAGAMFVVLGMGTSFQATQYALGTAARMGPGFLPHWLGLMLALVGAVLAFSACRELSRHTRVERIDWRVLVLIAGSIALFGLLLTYAGLILALVALVLVSSFASHVFSWKAALGNAVFLAGFSWLAFIKGLGLVIPVWPPILFSA